MKYFFRKLKIFFPAVIILAAAEGLLFPLSVRALSIDVHVPEKYTDVQAGDRFYFEMEVRYPENPARKDLQIEYDILENGKVIATSKFLKAVETQASFMDYVVIPESAKNGLHEIKAKVSDYEQLNSEVSASFMVTEKNHELKVYFFIIIGFITFFSLMIIWEIARLNRLKKQIK
jgi:hypothetical protein